MRTGDIFRVPKPQRPDDAVIDGFPNLYSITRAAGGGVLPFAAGINTMAAVTGLSGAARRPAVIIRSSPHKAGSDVTPWQNRFDPDLGQIRYFGDNKYPNRRPAHEARGNRSLLALRELHKSTESDERRQAAPLIFFRTTPVAGKAKGHVRFDGYGIIYRTELVTQIDPATRKPFTNYAFDCVVMSLAEENEEFDWDWIRARQDPARSDNECLQSAPAAWQRWVAQGDDAIDRVRRRVSALRVKAPSDQRPSPNTPERKALDAIYRFYEKRGRVRFEALAEVVAARVIGRSGTSYTPGWITRAGGDEGIDFVGRVDIGEGFSRTGLVVLGQAKCEHPGTATGGNHIARTVARLRRGWVGVYVTTSYFSKPVQQEVIEDRYPLLLIPGLRVAQEVIAMKIERKYASVVSVLEGIDDNYTDRLQIRDPEDVLLL